MSAMSSPPFMVARPIGPSVAGRGRAAPGAGAGGTGREGAMGGQGPVGKEAPRQPLRLDERPPGGDVMHERLGRIDERDVGHAVQRLGDGDAAVAAADDYDRG